MKNLKWWQKAVFYQIYPRSFADGNGDGIGDFPGMTAKLDYLQNLGVDAIWLSPHYPSPFLDCGYDVSDYSNVGPEYGTLADYKNFLDVAHARGIRVINDLVLNHTSHLHPWFIESKSSRDNPKRDWYIWRDGKNKQPPNNWASIFGGSAWELDETTGQYYYHAFLKEQPDLNWRNPEVKKAMWDMVRFWLDLGVDGFRLDAISTIYEDPNLPNQTFVKSPEELLDTNPLSWEDYEKLMEYQIHQPGIHELMQELRALVDEYPGDRVLVGEDEDIAYHGSGDDELHLLFNFPLMRTERLTPQHVRDNQAERLAELPAEAWPCNTLGNHDSSRFYNRYGDGVHDEALARLHLALLLTLKGTPFLYNGEEIGMVDFYLSELSQMRDTAAIHHYQSLTEKKGVTPEEALKSAVKKTRDRCRTPLQWDNGPNAGFSPANVATWLPVNPNYKQGVNVATQEKDANSLLNFYRQMLTLRRNTPALIAGNYTPLDTESNDYLAFLREDKDTQQTCVVLLNFTDKAQQINLDFAEKQLQILYASATEKKEGQALNSANLSLEPFEILITQVQ